MNAHGDPEPNRNHFGIMRISTLALALMLSVFHPAFADSWTSVDGKTITADFVRISGSKVILSMEGKEYPVPLEKLDEKSRGYARFLQAELTRWAHQNIDSPILPEQLLEEIIQFDAELVEGKTFLVEGYIGKIGQQRALARSVPTVAEFELRGGTSSKADLAEEVPNRGKLKYGPDQVELHLARSGGASGWKDYTFEKALLKVGQPVVVRLTVRDGKLVEGQLASSQEVTEARLIFARQNGGLTVDELADLERIKIRIQFLEAQLDSGDAGEATVTGVNGYIGTIKFKYSDAEKQRMQQELELLRAQLVAASRPEN